jgi:hypothetical protein
MKKILIPAVIFCIGVAFGLVLAHGTLNAQGAGDADVLAKLNDIAKSQEELMDTVKSIKEDLHIVKIRVTQLQ